MAVAKQKKSGEISITPIEFETIDIPIIGTSPLIMNRLAEKARLVAEALGVAGHIDSARRHAAAAIEHLRSTETS